MFDLLFARACELYDEGDALLPEAYAERLMELSGLPMHCPEHHFIVPAALLLAAHRIKNSAPERVQKDLQTAMVRAKTVPGGFCGNCGCCGAAVGTGLFLSIWYGTNPKSEEHWALVQKITARSLMKIAEVEGPRCCKRVTFLALDAARSFCASELDLNFGAPPAVVCRYFAHNKECRRAACPYFPRRQQSEEA